jgi:hypothetical protein
VGRGAGDGAWPARGCGLPDPSPPCATAPKSVIVATTTKAVALMSMPGTALSMLGATIMPTITTTPLWLLWLSWPLLSLPMGGARSGARWTASASL